MKTRMRPRYYCDHCGKGSGSPSAMRRHEAACTLNPKRICRMCDLMGNLVADNQLLDGMVMFLQPAIAEDWPARMRALREAVCNCPCCILAVIRQTGAVTPAPVDEEAPLFPKEMYFEAPTKNRALLGFDYKGEMAARLAEINEAQADDPRNYY